MVCAEIHKRSSRRHAILNQVRRGVGEQDLGTVSNSEHAREAVERPTEVITIAHVGRPGVDRQRDAHAQRPGHAQG